MNDRNASAEPTTPPPLPARNPLRNGAYQLKPRTIQSGNEISPSSPSSPASQILLAEIDRELIDTQQRLVSAIFEGGRMHASTSHESWKSLGGGGAGIMKRMLMESSDKQSFMSATESNSSRCEDRPEPLQPKSGASSMYSQNMEGGEEEGPVGSGELPQHVAVLQRNCDAAITRKCAPITENAGVRAPSSQYSEKKPVTKVEDWLARGFLSSTSEADEHPRQVNGDSDHTFPSRHPALSLFPPRSPSTGNREYTLPSCLFARPVCPMSPLNNGRDAYGNHIPSNTRDCFTAQSPPTSPELRAVPEVQAPPTLGGSSLRVRIRGGGWNNLKTLWKGTSAEESSRTSSPTPQHILTEERIVVQDPPVPVYAGRIDNRIPSSVRSQFSAGPRNGTLMTANRTPIVSSTVEEKRRNDEPTARFREDPIRPESPALTEGSSIIKENVEAVLDRYFGAQLTPATPISVGTRPHTSQEPEYTYGRKDVATWDKQRSGPFDDTFPQPHSTHVLSREVGYSHYSKKLEGENSKERPKSRDTWELETEKSASTTRSQKTAPRSEKRWNKDITHPPPSRPAPAPPSRLALELPKNDQSEDSNDDLESIFSSRTEGDRLRHLRGLTTSTVYRKASQAEVAKRLRERERAKRAAGDMTPQSPDISTIAPSESISRVGERHRAEARQGTQALARGMAPVGGQSRVHRFDHYRPHPGPNRVDTVFTLEQPHTIGHPPTVSPPVPADTQAPPSIAYEPTGKQHPHSKRTALSLAGKVSRFFLAAPLDPKYKTYSHRAEEKKRVGMGADQSGWPIGGTPMGIDGVPMPLSVSLMDGEPRVSFARRRSLVIRDDKKKRGNVNSKKREDQAVATPSTYPEGLPRSGARKLEKTPGPKHELEPSSILPPRPAAPSVVASTAQTIFPTEDPNGNVYVRTAQEQAVHEEALRFQQTYGYGYHYLVNRFYDHNDDDVPNGADDMTGKIRTFRLPKFHFPMPGPTPHVELRGGGSGKTALRVSRVSLDEATAEAITNASCDALRRASWGNEVKVRSSFSTDSNVSLEVERELRRKECRWRDEDGERALAMAMHKIG